MNWWWLTEDSAGTNPKVFEFGFFEFRFWRAEVQSSVFGKDSAYVRPNFPQTFFKIRPFLSGSGCSKFDFDKNK